MKSLEARLEYLEEQFIILKYTLSPQPQPLPHPNITEFLASPEVRNLPGIMVKARKRTPLQSLAKLYGLPCRQFKLVLPRAILDTRKRTRDHTIGRLIETVEL